MDQLAELAGKADDHIRSGKGWSSLGEVTRGLQKQLWVGPSHTLDGLVQSEYINVIGSTRLFRFALQPVRCAGYALTSDDNLSILCPPVL